jgi:hypothetical protein
MKQYKTELEAWEFIKGQFDSGIAPQGLCLEVTCLLTDGAIDEDLYMRMKDRIRNNKPDDRDMYSLWWYPWNEQGRTKRLAWIRQQITAIKEGK